MPPAAEIDLGFLAPPQGADELGRLGPYRVLQVLGRGGMGVVLRAEDPHLERIVALKVMLPEIAQKQSFRERFLREARAAAKLQHDHIISIHEVGEDRGIPYIAMPFLKGMTVEDWLKRKGPFTVPQALRLGREAAKGLLAAHERGLIHRDIKPANLWLDATAQGRIKILDFGLARPAQNDTNLTQDGAIVGTPAYMAPEQASGGQGVDFRADLFSLGAVLYLLCTGQKPFPGNSAIAILHALATLTPKPAQQLNPDVPLALSDLIMKLLEKDPTKRPESAREVIDVISAIERERVMQKIGQPSQPAPVTAITAAPAKVTKAVADDESSDSFLEFPDKIIEDRPKKKKKPVNIKKQPLGLYIAAGGCAVAVIGMLIVVLVARRDPEPVAVVRPDPPPAADPGRPPVRPPEGKPPEVKPPEVKPLVVVKPPPPPQPVSVFEFPPWAKAPFDAGRARSLQDDWARHLQRGVIDVNSVGMKLVLIPPGEFLMGSPDTEPERGPEEGPQRLVRITRPFRLGHTEVTQKEYQAVMNANPSSKQGEQLPVNEVTWDDAQAFCRALSALPSERAAGRRYRLPTEAEWEHACRAGSTLSYVVGSTDAELRRFAWFDGNARGELQPVAQLAANPWGLYDTLGSVWEMCADFSANDYYKKGPSSDPPGPTTSSRRVVRGGSVGWYGQCAYCRAARRGSIAVAPDAKDAKNGHVGFRVVCEIDGTPPLAVAPFDAATAGQHQKDWAEHLRRPEVETNTIGMKFALIPPGEFDMGSTEGELRYIAERHPTQAKEHVNEAPRHRVRITQPFRLGVSEVTVGQFAAFVRDTKYVTIAEKNGATEWDPVKKTHANNPQRNWRASRWPQTDDHPVGCMAWEDAVEFCQWLSRKENRAYRLPTEAEWEYACRAGTTGYFAFGDKITPQQAVFDRGNAGFPEKVGGRQPNAFGLQDMNGNLHEWCLDRLGGYPADLQIDPAGAPVGGRVLRGRCYDGATWHMRPASRFSRVAGYASASLGFRVACEFEPTRPPGFVPLLPGPGIAGWKQTRAGKLEDQWRIAGGVLTGLEADANLQSVNVWKDFRLRLQARFWANDAQSGVQMLARGRPGDLVEVELRPNATLGRLYIIQPGSSGYGGVTDTVSRGLGVWHNIEIIRRGRDLTVLVDNRVVIDSGGADANFLGNYLQDVVRLNLQNSPNVELREIWLQDLSGDKTPGF